MIAEWCAPCKAVTGRNPYAFLPAQLERIKRKEKQRKHYQRLMQRKQKGSNNRRKARYRVSRTFDYSRNVIENFAHQTSHAIATDAGIWVIGVEALKIANMTKHPKAKTDENGKFLPNGAKAKAGLNKSVLSSGWGKTLAHLKYKAAQHGKLVVEVPPAYTSQSCPACGRIDVKSRPTQTLFHCTGCGFHSDNADWVASINIRNKAVEMLLSGELEPKKTKKTTQSKASKAG